MVKPNHSTNLKYEKELVGLGLNYVAGIDEVGRGTLAGPVTAGLVIFPPDLQHQSVAEVTDSKKLSPIRRERLDIKIRNLALVSEIGWSTATEIDEIGISKATKLAMMRAIGKSIIKPDHLLIDAVKLDGANIAFTPIVKGDQISTSIAAASIIAKVARDTFMRDLDAGYPRYGFWSNKGYGTKAHLQAIREFGPINQHRMTFAPLKTLFV